MYDSTQDTKDHIARVRSLLIMSAGQLTARGVMHDQSKLQEPEKPLFDKLTPILKDLEYGSPEYKASLAELDVALQHHYANNSHHPQFYKNGIDGMNLFDVIEMFFDWKAATERVKGGDINKSIDINKDRFEMSSQLVSIFKNTVKNLGWEK